MLPFHGIDQMRDGTIYSRLLIKTEAARAKFACDVEKRSSRTFKFSTELSTGGFDDR